MCPGQRPSFHSRSHWSLECRRSGVRPGALRGGEWQALRGAALSATWSLIRAKPPLTRAEAQNFCHPPDRPKPRVRSGPSLIQLVVTAAFLKIALIFWWRTIFSSLESKDKSAVLASPGAAWFSPLHFQSNSVLGVWGWIPDRSVGKERNWATLYSPGFCFK